LLEALEDRLTPNTYTVNNLVDDGSPGSLSWAVAQANNNPGSDSINFDPAVTQNGAATITLTLGELDLTDTSGQTTIQGPGVNLLTVSGDKESRVFRVIPNASLNISGLTIAQGAPGTGDGGGIDNFGSLTIANCTLSDNSVAAGDGDGGGIANFGTLTVTACTFDGNLADFGSGGGLYNSSTATALVSSSTFTGSAAVVGAALVNQGQMTVVDSTFANNLATANGGAINNWGTLLLLDSTLAYNGAGSGGGLYLSAGAATLHNTLVAGNFSGPTPDDISTASLIFLVDQTSSYNLIGNAATAGGLVNGFNGNIVGQNGTGNLDFTTILDSMLHENGGPTPTLALVPDGPAMDAGDPNFDPNAFTPPLTTDQRGPGFPRVLNGRVDIGAFESQPLPPDHLQFGVQPSDTVAGVAISPAVTVRLLDSFGRLVSGDNTDQVTLTVASGPGSFAAGSTLTVTASGGIATFSNLVLTAAGQYTLGDTATGGVSGPVSSFFQVYALAAPSVPDLVATDDSGISSSDHVTNVAQPRFQGTGITGDTVQLFVNGVPNASGPVDTTGHWTIRLSAPLADGAYTIRAQQVDGVGEQSALTTAMSPPLVIDTQPPTSPQTIGAVDPSLTWYLRNENSAGAPDAGQFTFGFSGWIPVTGDWNGDGVSTIGAYDPTTTTWYLRNVNSAGAPDAGAFTFGAPGYIPVTGDWDGSGHTGIGVYDPTTFTWYLTNDDGPGAPVTAQFVFGGPGLIPVTGDWDGSGHTGIGVYDPTTLTWYLRSEVSAGPADAGQFQFGLAGLIPVTGDWNGSGHTGIGVYDPATLTWYLRNEVSAGPADAGQFQFGVPNSLPVTGSWGAATSFPSTLPPPTRAVCRRPAPSRTLLSPIFRVRRCHMPTSDSP
jgi:hypothetical protein